MSEGIDDILNGREPEPVTDKQPQAEAETVETNDAEPVKAEQPRGPDGKFAPKGETKDAPPASDEDRIPVSAIQDERRKRQELERRVADYEAKLQQLSNPPQPAPDMFENPEGWQSHFGNDIRQQAAQEASLNATLNTSEMLARDKFDDFEDMKASFLELAKDNPTLAQQALSDPHPWRKAYQIAKTHTTMQQVGATDVDSLRAQIRAELEAELKAQPAVDIPQTLATAQSGRTAVPPPNAPPSLQDLLR
jgi:hypothetical protein